MRSGPRCRRLDGRSPDHGARPLTWRSTMLQPNEGEAKGSEKESRRHGGRCESPSIRQRPPAPILCHRGVAPGDRLRHLLAQGCGELQRRIGGREERTQPFLIRVLTPLLERGLVYLWLSLAH